jgi:hypothetical protein
MPQSSRPGIGGGRSRDLMRVSSSGESSVVEDDASFDSTVDDPDAWALASG